MRLVLLLSCLLGLGLGASFQRKPHHCKSPPLLTGALTVSTQNEKAWFYAPYEYDAIGQRIRIYEVGTYQNQSFTFDALLLFREGVMYRIDDKASKCTKLALKGDFVPMGVPPNATLVGSAVLGSSSEPGQGLLVDTWGGQNVDGAKYMMTVTGFGCIPVSVVAQTAEFGWVLVSYINAVQGIVDPNVLNPPPFCPDQDVKPQGKPMDFFSIIKNMANNAP